MAHIRLDCGCEAVVTHMRGDRLVTCRHQFVHAVNAKDGVIYTAKRMKRGA